MTFTLSFSITVMSFATPFAAFAALSCANAGAAVIPARNTPIASADKTRADAFIATPLFCHCRNSPLMEAACILRSQRDAGGLASVLAARCSHARPRPDADCVSRHLARDARATGGG